MVSGYTNGGVSAWEAGPQTPAALQSEGTGEEDKDDRADSQVLGGLPF